ncbi:SMP-30/gluconolaconase/LRE-like region-containing protein [Sphingobacterium deserti]|uniref:SMP-30/gluconolaconase/LRE-like region-containing protein n=2 Tax=Sphingobacterium deserti TaxID=1229276 RepID=A0A0B8T032_9SPHI|nr:SMP-30/gluconolaconase/LRE-like region-containing protein [Sphingobacterium deserti]
MLMLLTTLLGRAQSHGELIEISSQFSFTEGPTADSLGNIFFTDQPNNSIWKYDTAGKLSLFMQPAGRSNGMFIDKEGFIISCADEKNELWRIHPVSKAVEVLVTDYGNKKLNGPNDVWVSPNGLMYFTDPFYDRDYWQRGGSELPQALYMLHQGKLHQVGGQFEKPNGIIGSRDGKHLFVADIGADKTYIYDIDDEGKPANRRLFCDKGSDGMTIDDKGNIYLTGKGVFVYNKDGQQIRHIAVPAEWTANVCFGGTNNAYLFITASEKIFKIYPDW